MYFECNIRANPVMYKVMWKHNVSVDRPSSAEYILMRFASTTGQGSVEYVQRWNHNFKSKLSDYECEEVADGSVHMHCHKCGR